MIFFLQSVVTENRRGRTRGSHRGEAAGSRRPCRAAFGHACRFTDRAPMPTRFPHGGEDAPLLAGDSRGRGGNAKKSSDGGVDKLMSRGVTVLAALLLLGLCAMLGVHLMGSNHSADSDLSNKDRSWIETLDDGTKILHGADGKLSVVTGDSVTKSPKHHKKKGSGDILDLLHDQNAKGSIDGEIDPTKDIASQQNDILLNKEKEMMDSLTAMANGGKDGSKKGKDPSVNPAEEAQKMMAGDAKSTTSTFDPRAAYKRHQEALSHLSKKDKHANENLKLTEKEKSELEQLESPHPQAPARASRVRHPRGAAPAQGCDEG